MSSLRFGHDTLRISERTSRRNFVILFQRVGLLWTVATFFTSFCTLTGFFVSGMGPAELAELLDLNAIRIVLLVLVSTIVPVLALGTL